MIDLLRERWAALVIAGGALFGLWTLWALPALESWREAQEATMSLELERAALAEAAPEASGGGALAASLFELRFGAGGVSSEQDRAYELADAAGVTVTQIEASPDADRIPVGPAQLVKGSMSLEAEGSFAAVVGFLDAVEAEPMATVERFEVSPMGEGSGVRLEAEVSLVRLERRGRAVAEGGVE
jgi:hypothetical protein